MKCMRSVGKCARVRVCVYNTYEKKLWPLSKTHTFPANSNVVEYIHIYNMAMVIVELRDRLFQMKLNSEKHNLTNSATQKPIWNAFMDHISSTSSLLSFMNMEHMHMFTQTTGFIGFWTKWTRQHMWSIYMWESMHTCMCAKTEVRRGSIITIIIIMIITIVIHMPHSFGCTQYSYSIVISWYMNKPLKKDEQSQKERERERESNIACEDETE